MLAIVLQQDITCVGNVRMGIECGLLCVRQHHYAEAAAHFALAREQLARARPTTLLVTALDAFLESHARYLQAQQTLHEASQRFAAAIADQQVQINALQTLLADGSREVTDRPARQSALGQPRPSRGRDQALPPPIDVDDALPPLRITCFGRFEVQRCSERVELCQNRSGQVILRYLVAQPLHRATMDRLMETLWPEDPPAIARHKLHCASSALRRTLNSNCAYHKGAGYLLCIDGGYQLNPSVAIAIDAEEFWENYLAGQRVGGSAAAAYYETACRLYTGPFLPEDLYADWSIVRREQLAQAYLSMCRALVAHHQANARYDEAIQWALKILAEDCCDETAYQQLIYSHAAVGRRKEALQQYQHCERVLTEELGIRPMLETTALVDAIRRGQPLPAVSEQGHGRGIGASHPLGA
ncbi:MAG TPA: BTAD domain-containing putative transcriptional regulator [Herpetosiphonaceae bacterium]|nr:BTAD domain-containing putative transcriptional regulator [Herpetosiphonaceae bacterium]